MSNLDQIQRLCEEYVGRKFGKRDKNDLTNFLRGLQGQRVGDSDEEHEQPQKTYAETRPPPVEKRTHEIETPAVMKENAPIARKAASFIGNVNESNQAPEPKGTPVKVADFDDIEGVKDRRGKWEGGQVIGAEGIKPPVDGYKLDETEQTKARMQKWEEGQVIGAEGIRQPVDGYKLEENEEVKARKQKWEGGQVIGAEGIRQTVDGYKLEENEEVKARKQKWEGGQVIGAQGTSTFSPEGYKLNESVGLKDRLNKWSQVASTIPMAKIDKSDDLPEASSPRTKDSRFKQWEEGTVATPTKQDPAKVPVKFAEADGPAVDGVKDRLSKWSEVTKDPEPGPRKEPVKIYEGDQ